MAPCSDLFQMTGTVKKTSMRLADGRELIYFGTVPERPQDYPDRRPLAGVQVSSQRRYDWLLGEWVVVASHRQDRTFLPADDQCPLDPSAPGRLTEIPAPAYDVVVFENRFPTLAEHPDPPATGGSGPAGGSRSPGGPTGPATPGPGAAGSSDGLLLQRPGTGRCEVVCFSQEHTASFADLTIVQAGTVLDAWIDRTAELSRLPGVDQVFCFENRGQEIGVTLSHPHGQIYAYPFVTPRTSRMISTSTAYRQRTGRNLFDDILAAELSDGSRIVRATRHWTAFVPHAAHWPYEVHLYPSRRVPDLLALSRTEQAEFCDLYLDLLRRFDRLFDAPAPYISAWHQAPVRQGRAEFALHLELFTVRRASGKLKYLAGSESGMGAFANDIPPEVAADRLRQLG
jgi:UDPglucose--hexose-1-phosphate uridylyltransferase